MSKFFVCARFLFTFVLFCFDDLIFVVCWQDFDDFCKYFLRGTELHAGYLTCLELANICMRFIVNSIDKNNSLNVHSNLNLNLNNLVGHRIVSYKQCVMDEELRNIFKLLNFHYYDERDQRFVICNEIPPEYVCWNAFYAFDQYLRAIEAKLGTKKNGIYTADKCCFYDARENQRVHDSVSNQVSYETQKEHDEDFSGIVMILIGICYLFSLIFDILATMELISSGESNGAFLGWSCIFFAFVIYIISGILHCKIGINKSANSLVSAFKFPKPIDIKSRKKLERRLMLCGTIGTCVRSAIETIRPSFRETENRIAFDIVSQHRKSGLLLLLYVGGLYPLYLC